LKILQVPALSKLPWLIHGFSTRPGGVSPLVGHSAAATENVEGVLNLGFTEWDTRENVLENRRRLQAGADAPDLPLIALRQSHSDVIFVFDDVPADSCRGDASITKATSDMEIEKLKAELTKNVEQYRAGLDLTHTARKEVSQCLSDVNIAFSKLHPIVAGQSLDGEERKECIESLQKAADVFSKATGMGYISGACAVRCFRMLLRRSRFRV
jgi:hypothetical protein